MRADRSAWMSRLSLIPDHRMHWVRAERPDVYENS
jgi:hypothetical protein